MKNDAYLGIYANPEKSVKGTGNSLMKCVKTLSLKNEQFHTLKLEALANNKRAIDFYRKMGFVEEDQIKDFIMKDGECRMYLLWKS